MLIVVSLGGCLQNDTEQNLPAIVPNACREAPDPGKEHGAPLSIHDLREATDVQDASLSQQDINAILEAVVDRIVSFQETPYTRANASIRRSRPASLEARWTFEFEGGFETNGTDRYRLLIEQGGDQWTVQPAAPPDRRAIPGDLEDRASEVFRRHAAHPWVRNTATYRLGSSWSISWPRCVALHFSTDPPDRQTNLSPRATVYVDTGRKEIPRDGIVIFPDGEGPPVRWRRGG